MDIKKYLKDVKDKKRQKFVEAAIKIGVKIEIISEDFRLLKLTWKGKTKILYKSKPYFNLDPSTFLTKHKELTKILLRFAKIKVPSGIYAKNLPEALRRMRNDKILFPVVVKPIDAAEGLCVTVGVTDKKELNSSIKKIKCSVRKARWPLSGIFMVEEMISGNDYRILVLNNKIIACAERVPAFIIGDGKTNVSELIKKYNRKRLPAYILKIDKDLKNNLLKEGLSLKSVLGKDQYLQLRKNANISTGGKAVDKTGQVSKRFERISLQCMKALGLNYAGIDLMTSDISSNNPLQPYAVIEINGNPDYEPHGKPIVVGKGVDVAKILVKEFMRMK